jgi:hypothetical protein
MEMFDGLVVKFISVCRGPLPRGSACARQAPGGAWQPAMTMEMFDGLVFKLCVSARSSARRASVFPLICSD